MNDWDQNPKLAKVPSGMPTAPAPASRSEVRTVDAREALEAAKAAMLRTRTASIAGCEEGYGKPEKWGDELFASHGDLTKAIKLCEAVLTGTPDAAQASTEAREKEITRLATIELCAQAAEKLHEKPGWSPHYKNASLAIAHLIRGLAQPSADGGPAA